MDTKELTTPVALLRGFVVYELPINNICVGQTYRLSPAPRRARDALAGAYNFEPRGLVEIKGIGTLETWWLLPGSGVLTPTA